MASQASPPRYATVASLIFSSLAFALSIYAFLKPLAFNITQKAGLEIANAHPPKQILICTGDNQSECPQAPHKFIACPNLTADEYIKRVCPSAKGSVQFLTAYSGGQCGYGVLNVNCDDAGK